MNEFAKPGLGVTQLPPVSSADVGKVPVVNEDGSWGIGEGGGGGGSNVLVAHATVDMTDLDNFDPETPLPITLDKTYAELAAEEVSAVMISWEQAGTPVGDSLFMFDSNASFGPVLYYDAPVYVNEALFEGTGWKVLVTVTSGEGAALAALPASSGGGYEPLTIGVTVSMSGDDVVYTMDKTWSEIWTAVSANRLCVGFIDVGASTKSQIWVSGVTSEGGAYVVMVPDMSGGMMSFVASGESGYPIYTLQNGG